jgi:hypothetical protein
MIICVAKEILYPDTPKYPKEILFANHCQAIDYTRCWEQFLSYYLLLILLIEFTLYLIIINAKIKTHHNANGRIIPLIYIVVVIQKRIPNIPATIIGHGNAKPGSPPFPNIPTPNIRL